MHRLWQKKFKGIKLNKYIITITTLIILLVSSIIANILQYNEINYLNEDNQSHQHYISVLEDENSKQQNWINLYENKVVTIAKDSKIYHKGSCEPIKGETINLAWKSGIKKEYTACPYCHK